jgi:septal ring factor EnvC (AmiA/AmiB activator)
MADAIETATASLRDAVGALEAEESRLKAELAEVTNKRQAAAKALEALSGEKPKRRRGRPRNADRVTEAVAA